MALAANPRTRARAQYLVRGLYGMADASVPGGDVIALGHTLLEAGCTVLQLRAKDWEGARIRKAAIQLLAACRAVDSAFIVNDDPALAAEIGAHGVHLGQLDGDIAEARALLPDGIIGRSSHSLAQALEAVEQGADYVAFGPVFATDNLSRRKAVRGVAALAEVRLALAAHIPMVAIGGIGPENLPLVRRTAVESWAVIHAVSHAPDPLQAALQLL